MELYQLRSFIPVVEEGNITKAAKRLNMTQSALSMQIKALEEALNTTLFTRSSRGMSLTENGKILLPYIESVLSSVDVLNHKAHTLGSNITGTLTIGLNTDPAFLHMSAQDEAIAASYPELRLTFLTSQTMTTPAMLQEKIIDVGFAFGDATPKGITGFFLQDVPIRIVIPVNLLPNPPHMAMATMTWETLSTMPWVWTSCDCPFHMAVENAMRQRGVQPNAVAEALDEMIVREMVGSGKGVSIMRKDQAEALAETGKAVVWNTPLSVPLTLYYCTDRKNESSIHAFIQTIKNLWPTLKVQKK